MHSKTGFDVGKLLAVTFLLLVAVRVYASGELADRSDDKPVDWDVYEAAFCPHRERIPATRINESTPVEADKTFVDWSQVKMSIAMIRTSAMPACLGNCLGLAWRGSKARLTFPPEFLDRVKEELGGNIGKSWFLVSIDNIFVSDDLKIFFDFNNMKRTSDGRFYFERSSNQGKVEGPRCSELRYVNTQNPAPLSFFLEYVRFESSDGSRFVTLYPDTRPEATTTGGRVFSCGGPFVTEDVMPWDPEIEEFSQRMHIK